MFGITYANDTEAVRWEMMVQPSDSAVSDAPNHPSAWRMGVIAFLAHNVIIGSIFGTTGVLLKPMTERLGVSLQAASVGAPMVMIGSAVLASVAGALAARYSLRVLLLVAALGLGAGWFLLGLTTSYTAYLIAYGVLLGPAMAIGGTVLPPTLITRWFNRNRGLATGIAHMSVVIAIMPLLANRIIESYGLQTTFFALALFGLIVLVPAALLVIEYPPDHPGQPVSAKQALGSDGGMTVPQLFATGTFWLLALAVAAPNVSSVLLGVHLVSMAENWGYTRENGALLASVMSFVGIVGFLVFGWISDKLGGVRTLALIAFDEAILWSAFQLHLPFPGLVVLIGLIGMHGAGTIPALAKAIPVAFGQASFSRAFGLTATASLPVMVIAIIGTSAAVSQTGSYFIPTVGMAAFLVLGLLAALACIRRPAPQVSPAVPLR